MKNIALTALGALVLALCPAAHAQWVVHAMTGTLKSINTNAKTLSLAADDGNPAIFNMQPKGDSKVEFDPKLRAESTPAESYSTVGSHVVVFYYGYGSDLTAISVETLSNGPFTTATGKVDKFDKKSRTLIIKTDAGATATFHVQDNAVIDTGNGVKEGTRFDPHKGDPVRIMSGATNQGDPQAVFIQRNGY